MSNCIYSPALGFGCALCDTFEFELLFQKWVFIGGSGNGFVSGWYSFPFDVCLCDKLHSMESFFFSLLFLLFSSFILVRAYRSFVVVLCGG